jgi:uncharacterized phage protein gp47/JayE
MPTYGLTSEGFVPKTLEIIRAEREASYRSEFGAAVPLGDRTFLGIVTGIESEREALLWEISEQIYNANDPEAATQAALDGVCALTGTTRDPARESTVTLFLTGTVATIVPIGSRAATSTDAEFATTAEVTLIACTAWAPTTAYDVDVVRTNGGRIYVSTIAGTSAGAGGPTGTGTAIVDGTVTWRYIGEGAGIIAAPAESVETGPIEAPTYSINEIVTPVSGWQSVINLEDAEIGANVETDESLRIKREDELSGGGTATVDAILAAVLDVEGVTSCTVFENTTDTTDADGVPPHAVEVLVRGGADADIWQALFDSVAAGILAYGDEEGGILDSEGNLHIVQFSRPTEVNIYVDVTLVKLSTVYPTDGDDQVKAAIVAYGDAQATGRDVVSAMLLAQVAAIPGVLDVSLPEIDTAPSPTTTTTITITSRQLAVFDTARITVASSNGTP